MDSPSLAELQSALTARISGAEAPAALEEWIRVPRGADPDVRFSIHREGYPARIAASLGEAFPALANVLGEGSLATLTERFIESGLPPERNLNRVGRALPGFLARDPLTAEVPFLPDLAELEWAIFECFHSEMGRDFDVASIAALSHEALARCRIAFRPGTAVVTSAWPIRALWMTRDRDRSEIDVDVTAHPEQVVVHRVGYVVEARSIDPLEAHALECLLEGARLGEAISGLAERGAEPERVQGCFASWVSLGLVSDCRPT